MPINTSSIFGTIAGWHEGRVIRIRRNFHSLMSAAGTAEVIMVADGGGNFIFPDFHPAIDGMTAAIRLLEYLARRGMYMADVVDYLPQAHTAQAQIDCPWQSKGAVMRRLNEQFSGPNVEKIDGLKIRINDHDWVHILPNPEKPLFELFAEAAEQSAADRIIAEYQATIQGIVDGPP